jgi:hypothetical protein
LGTSLSMHGKKGLLSQPYKVAKTHSFTLHKWAKVLSLFDC